MPFDPDTLFFAAGICATALAVTMLSVWFQNRVDRFLVGWMTGMALVGTGVILYSTLPPDRIAVPTVAFALEIVGFVAVFVAAGQFVGRQVDWSRTSALCLAVACPVAVPIACGFDGFGIMVYNFLAAALLAMTARRYWIVRTEAPVFIAGITVLYLLSALSFLACGAMLLHDRSWVLDGRPDNWAEHFNAIMSIAGITGIGSLSLALNQSRAARRHRHEARTDALTGLLNRRAFDESLDTLIEEARESGQPLSMVLVDADHFKRINDEIGHVFGDRVLRGIAEVLAKNVKGKDLLARYGGEEFALLLPGADASSARAVAQRCMQEVAHAGIVHAASPLGQQLTVSVGMGTALPGTQDDSKRFLETVDRCLYRAKHAGRNRIEATA